MSDKKKLISILIVTILMFVGGTLFFLSGNQKTKELKSNDNKRTEKILILDKKELGLHMEKRLDNNAVRFIIDNPKDITKIEYELSYVAEGDQPRGVIGEVTHDGSEKSIVSEYLDLGSCSRNVCKYDLGVEKVDLLLKIIKKGQIYQAEDSLLINNN